MKDDVRIDIRGMRLLGFLIAFGSILNLFALFGFAAGIVGGLAICGAAAVLNIVFEVLNKLHSRIEKLEKQSTEKEVNKHE